MGFTILINEHSGSVAQHGRSVLSEKFKDILGADLEALHFLPPDEFEDALQDLDQDAQVLIGGGDGTIRSAAAILSKRGIAFGILPLGTMNLFAKDLELELDLFKLIESYKNVRELKIDAATANGEMFLCNAMVGIPSEIAKARDEHRSKETLLKWLALVKHGFDKLTHHRPRPMSLTYHGITERKLIKAAVIANNEYQDAAGLGTFKKKSLSDGKLTIYTVNPQGALESIALLSKLALGLWKQAEGLESFDVKALKLETRHSKIDVLLDGEIYRMRTPLNFKAEPKALTLLVPEG